MKIAKWLPLNFYHLKYVKNIASPICIFTVHVLTTRGEGRVVRWCWVNFQCRGVHLIWIIAGQGPSALAVGVGGVVWTFFSCLSFLFSFSLSLEDGPI